MTSLRSGVLSSVGYPLMSLPGYNGYFNSYSYVRPSCLNIGLETKWKDRNLGKQFIGEMNTNLYDMKVRKDLDMRVTRVHFRSLDSAQ